MLLINLNSKETENGYAYDFTTQLNPNLNLGEEYSKVGLYGLQMWNSLPNISVSRNNQTFRYYNGSSWSANLTIPQGSYSIPDINTKIQDLINSNGGVGSNITLLPNYNTLKCDIVLLNSYQLDLSIGNLHSLLGFDSQIVTSNKSGENLVDISNGITSYNVHCSLVNTSSSISKGSQSDVIYSFVPDVASGALINKEVMNIIYVKLNSQYLSQINIRITDQSNNTLYDLSNENVGISLVII